MYKINVLALVLICCASQVNASTPTFDHNSKLGMCVGLSKIANIQIEQQKITKSIDHSEGQERAQGAMSYGGGYAMGLVDMYHTLKPKEKVRLLQLSRSFSKQGVRCINRKRFFVRDLNTL